jgi:hypothetical protein
MTKCQTRGAPGHLHLAQAAVRSHELLGLGPLRQLPRVKAAQRVDEPSPASEQIIGEFDHQRVWPSLRPQLEKVRENSFLGFRAIGLRQKNRHRRGRTRNAHMAVNKQVGTGAPRGGRNHLGAEVQNGLDVLRLREHQIRAGLYNVMKAQRGAVMWIICPKRFGFRPLRIED